MNTNHVIIIAEAGVNHNGSLKLAKELIDVAADAGVDYVKFQTFKAEELVSKKAEKADYQKENTSDSSTSQYEMLKNLELSESDHFELINYCQEKGIKFFSTAFDLSSIRFLKSLNLGLWKIPSGEITNYPYIREIAKFKEPVILSTGMSELNEIQEAIDVLEKFGLKRNQISILHCNTQYPTPMADVNLRAMNSMAEIFNANIGYSDHTQGVEIPIAAVALGAKIIEKHFTLDKTMEGPDHKASLDPNELQEMVKGIRNTELALGENKKNVSKSEFKNITVARKSIVASKKIAKGELLTEENITVKRPGTGITPMKWEAVIGSVASKSYNQDDLIEL